MSKAAIYDQHDQAFRTVQAYVVCIGAERFATVAFKFGDSGRVTCYLHVLGFPMVRAFAGGGGYDKKSAAMYAACKKVVYQGGTTPEEQMRYDLTKLFLASVKDGGRCWDDDLRAATFHVWQAV